MKLLVCGGRHYLDERRVMEVLDAMHPTEIITGDADGADSWARAYATVNNISLRVFNAEWSTFGKAAGPMRNARMLAEGKPDAAVAFPGGSGTRDMIMRLRAAGVPVEEVAS
jgi:hypothetical protein